MTPSLPLQSGERVQRFLDPHSALIERPGPNVLVESVGVPLRVPDESGEMVPLDLDLTPRGVRFEPENPLSELRLPERLRDGALLADSGVEITPVLEAGRDPQAVLTDDDKLFYANSHTDTDTLLAPTPRGVAIAFVLRSQDSPGQLRIKLDTPPGATLRLSEHRGVRGAEIRDAQGESLAFVKPPMAYDADRTPVPVEYSVEGSDLLVTVAHDDGDYSMPIFVDPEVIDSYDFGGAPGGWAFDGWWFGRNDGRFGGNATNAWWGAGLYTAMQYGQSAPQFYSQGSFGEWLVDAWPDTSITRFTSYGALMVNSLNTCTEQFLWTPWSVDGYKGADWPYYWCNAFSNGSHTSYGPIRYGNRAIFKLNVHTAHSRGAYDTWNYLDGASLGQTEAYAPEVYGVNSGAPQGWTQDFSADAQVSARDRGFGLWDLRVSHNGRDVGSHPGATRCGYRQRLCSRDGTWPSRYSTTSLPEGVSRLHPYALDAVDNPSPQTAFDFDVKIDRTPPAMPSVDGGAVKPGAVVGGGTHALVAASSDTHSGVKDLSYRVDGGTWSTVTRNCDAGPCSHPFSVDTTAQGLAEGRHTVDAKASDRVGQESNIRSFEFSVDRSGPEIRDVVRTPRYLKAASYDVTASAKEGSNLFTDMSFERKLPDGASGYWTSISKSNEVTPAAHGRHVARLRSDRTGDSQLVQDSGRLDVQAGEQISLSGSMRSTITSRRFAVGARFFNASGVMIDQPHTAQATAGSAGWTRAEGTVTAPAGAATVGWVVTVYGALLGEVNYVDALQVERAARPAAYSERKEDTAGVTKMELLVDGAVLAEPNPSQPRYTKTWDCPERGCARTHTFSLDAGALAQGLRRVSVRATDGLGTATTATEWDVVVDHEAPAVTPSGTLKDKEDQALLDPEYGLHVEATDASTAGARSGVGTIEYLLDDERQGTPVNQTCSATQDNCPLSGDFSFRTAEHEDGLYTIGARATDRAGNVGEVSWDVYDDDQHRTSLDRDEPDGYEVKSRRTYQPGTRRVQTRTYLDEAGLHRELVRTSSEMEENSDGDIEPEVNTLSLDGPAGVYRRTGDYTAEIPTNASRPVRFSVGNDWVEFGLVDGAGAASVDEANARFNNVLGGTIPSQVDLTYEALDEGLKEEIVLNQPLLSPLEFRFDVTISPGLTASPAADGGIDFLAPDGARRFGFEAPLMADGSDTPAGFSRDVTLTLGPVVAGRTTLIVTPNRAWVTSPLRIGPVVIDPTITRKKGKGSWDPLFRVLAFGNSTWSSDGQCCEEEETREFKPDIHPQLHDFARMAGDGLEYTRLFMFPCKNFDPQNESARWNYINRFVRETARRRVQILPVISQGLYCGGQPERKSLAPGKNPPNNAIEYADMKDAGRELARQYGPVQVGADGRPDPATGRFWQASGCRFRPVLGRYYSYADADPVCDADHNGTFGGPGDLWYVPVRAWQVWNEPNIAKGWAGGNPVDETPEGDGVHDTINPAHYREALRSTREGLISVDPLARIVAAGLGAQRASIAADEDDGPARTITFPYRYGARPFLGRVLGGDDEKGGEDSCLIDAAAMHVYRHERLFFKERKPDRVATYYEAEKPATVRKFLSRSYRQVLNRNGARSTPVWITEFGAASNDPSAPGELRNLNNDQRIGPLEEPTEVVSPQQQAAWIRDVIDALTGNDKRSGTNWRATLGVGPMLHFAWADNRLFYDDPNTDPPAPTRLPYAQRAGLWREPGPIANGGSPGDERTRVNRPDGSPVRKPAGGVAAELGREATALAFKPPRICPGDPSGRQTPG